MVTPEPEIPKPSPDRAHDYTQELIRIVSDLVHELHPQLRKPVAVSLKTDLDRDLGLDSLGRAELILRLDKAFKVRLPDHVLSEAKHVGDLLDALGNAAPALATVSTTKSNPRFELPVAAAPTFARTLIEVLSFHVDMHPDRPHLRLWKDDQHDEVITYGSLHEAALRVANGLLMRGLVLGDRVAIMLPTKADFFHSVIGTLYAGGIPVPVYPPFRRSQVEDHLRRQAGILGNAETRFLIIDEELRSIGSLLFGLVDSLVHIESVSVLSKEKGASVPMRAGPETIALIQYTSGSTGDPKGVVLTHANILANVRAMGDALEAGSEDVFVSWLPLYHDMGLIGAWFGSLYFGAQAIIMPPLAFLADPARWLRAISRYRATLSAAPNFAFELCTKNIHDDDIEGLDLSTLRLIVNGAEPVLPSTLDRFAARFASYGLRPEMIGPVYGLAENAVGLAFPPLGRAPLVDCIDRTALSRDGRAVPTQTNDPTALRFVACGSPLPRHEIRIVDESGREVPDRVEGRLQFRGPSATSGYFRNEEKNRTLFSGNWLESGDRAYLAGGDVFITGRIKDMIIKAGRNIYPHEVEEIVGQIEGVRKGCVAAIASTDSRTGSEHLVTIAETRLADFEEKELLRRRIVEVCSDAFDMPPDVVVVAPPHTVPKTSSGKIRRAAMRELYECGLHTTGDRGLGWQLILLAIYGLAGRMRRLRRRLFEVAFAGYWWFVLGVIAAPTWLAVVLLPQHAARHQVLRWAARVFLSMVGTSPQVAGGSNCTDEARIVVVNHASYVDSIVLTAVLPAPLTFVAKEELSRQWIAGPFLRRLGTLFARRTQATAGVEDTARQVEAVRAGERLVSYPEATLTRMPGLLDFRLGPFLVAAETGVEVLPVTLRGTRSVLRGEQWFPRHDRICVKISQPVRPDGTDFSAAIRLRDKVRATILLECGESDLSGEHNVIPSA
jgi:1-acyl-sn-glycerol-3-phosphate acyltransferase